jgi:hypothetical protein
MKSQKPFLLIMLDGMLGDLIFYAVVAKAAQIFTKNSGEKPTQGES